MQIGVAQYMALRHMAWAAVMLHAAHVAERRTTHDAARRESILQPKHAKPSFFSGLRQTSDLSPKNSGKITVCDQCHCH